MPYPPADDCPVNSSYIKDGTPPGPGFYQAEAAGLRWLAQAGGPPVPRVQHVSERMISLDRVATARPNAAAARRFGRDLARLHRSGAPAFGSPPPGAPAQGWIGNLPMAYGGHQDFATFWAQCRISPTARAARSAGSISAADLARIDAFAAGLEAGSVDVGPPVPPGRLHGDLWSGNTLWGADGRVWLIDPAAHGGHPSTDLAMLELFGSAHLDEILAGHEEVSGIRRLSRPLLALHQLWPLLVHAALFGPGYGREAMVALRMALT